MEKIRQMGLKVAKYSAKVVLVTRELMAEGGWYWGGLPKTNVWETLCECVCVCVYVCMLGIYLQWGWVCLSLFRLVLVWYWHWWQGLWKLYGIKDFNIIKNFLKEKNHYIMIYIVIVI